MEKNHPYLMFAFSTILYPSRTLFVPYFTNFNRIKSQQYPISAFSMEENPSRNLFLLLEQPNTPAVSYFIIFNRIEPQQHLISGFLIEENPSRTLFLLFEQHKTLAIP